MAKEKLTDHYSFVGGIVQDRGIIRIIAQSDELNEAGEPNSTLMKWVASESRWYDFHLPWYVTRICAVTTPELCVVMTGPQGRVGSSTVQEHREIEIDPSDSGPGTHGVIRGLSLIGNRIYAVGMGRQVYRREKDGTWSHRDSGVLQEPDTEHVFGFNSIAGLKDSDMYAVGFAGEIWHFRRKRWHKVDSPTSVILNDVAVVRPDLVFAAGQLGTLLRGAGDEWDVVIHETTEDQIWGLAWFNEVLYLATEDSVFRLAPDDSLEEVEIDKRGQLTAGFLHANDGILMSVGRKHVHWTEDGDTWHTLA